MMEERDNYWDDDTLEVVNRFKRSLISGNHKYFDVSEFEAIVEQLLDEGDLHGSEIAAEQGIKIHPNAVPLQLKYAQILINKGHYEKSLKYQPRRVLKTQCSSLCSLGQTQTRTDAFPFATDRTGLTWNWRLS